MTTLSGVVCIVLLAIMGLLIGRLAIGPTVSDLIGALPLLVALAVAEGPLTNYGGRALLVTFLLLVLNPAASHALSRAAYKSGTPMWTGSVVDEPRHRRGEAEP